MLPCELAEASNDATVAGVDGIGPRGSDGDDFGRFSDADDDKDAPTGDLGEDDAADVVGDAALFKPFPELLNGAGGDPDNAGGVMGEDEIVGVNPDDDAAARDWACAAAKLAANAGCNPGGKKGLLVKSGWCCCCAAACDAIAEAIAAAAACRKAG